MHRRTVSQTHRTPTTSEIKPASPRTPRNQSLSAAAALTTSPPISSAGSSQSSPTTSLLLDSLSNLAKSSSTSTLIREIEYAQIIFADMDKNWFGTPENSNTISSSQTAQLPNPFLTAAKQTAADCAIMDVTVLSGLTNLWQSLVLDYCSSYVQAFFNASSNIILTDDLKNTLSYVQIIEHYTNLSNEIQKYKELTEQYCKKNILTAKQKNHIKLKIETYKNRFEPINQQLRQQNSLHKHRWQPSCKLTGNVLTAISYLLAQHSIHSPILLPIACIGAISVRFIAYCGDNIIKQRLSKQTIAKHSRSVQNSLVRPNSLHQLVNQHPESFSNISPDQQTQNQLLKLIAWQLQSIEQKNKYQNLPEWTNLQKVKCLVEQNNWDNLKQQYPKHLITKCLNSPWLLHLHTLNHEFQQPSFQLSAIHEVIKDLPIILLQNIAQIIHEQISKYQDTLIDKDIMLVIEQLAKKVLNQIHDDGSIQQQQRLDIPRLLQKLLVQPLKIPFKAYENYKTATNMRNTLKQQLKDLEALTN